MSDKSEYLVVIKAYGDGEAFSGLRWSSIRCNRLEIAERIVAWAEDSKDCTAKAFHDFPKIGQ